MMVRIYRTEKNTTSYGMMWYSRQSLPRNLRNVANLPQKQKAYYHKGILCGMVDETPIIKHDTRILRPWEWYLIRDNLKPGPQLICDVSLNTQMRSTELWCFLRNQKWFRESGKAIDLPKEAILKYRVTLDERTVLLSDKGVEFVHAIFDCSARVREEIDRSNLRKDLIKAAEEAKISTKGICPKMFRKTIISWLTATFPEKEPYILMSAGHGKDVQQRHYLAAGFERGSIEEIRKYLKGWGEA